MIATLLALLALVQVVAAARMTFLAAGSSWNLPGDAVACDGEASLTLNVLAPAGTTGPPGAILGLADAAAVRVGRGPDVPA